MEEPIKLRSWLCSVAFVNIVKYSLQPVEVQMEWKGRFNRYLAEAVAEIAPADRVLLDTGDGAAICFLGDPESAMFATLTFLDSLMHEEAAVANGMRVRVGINLGSVKLVRDINGNINAVGDGINVAQRVMSFASENQILVSRSFYEVVSCLSATYSQLFDYTGVRKDKHVREHTLYNLRPPRAAPHPAAVEGGSTEAMQAAPRSIDPAVVARLEGALTDILGPMGRHLVKSAGRRCGTAGELFRALLAGIGDVKDRAAFQKAFGGEFEVEVDPAADAPVTPAEGPRAWDPAVLERAKEDLATYMGPMARVLVGRIAPRARTVEQLYDLLAAEIPSAEERKGFRKLGP